MDLIPHPILSLGDAYYQFPFVIFALVALVEERHKLIAYLGFFSYTLYQNFSLFGVSTISIFTTTVFIFLFNACRMVLPVQGRHVGSIASSCMMISGFLAMLFFT